MSQRVRKLARDIHVGDYYQGVRVKEITRDGNEVILHLADNTIETFLYGHWVEVIDASYSLRRSLQGR